MTFNLTTAFPSWPTWWGWRVERAVHPQAANHLIVQARRWLPGRELIVVADGGYAVLDLVAWCQRLGDNRVTERFTDFLSASWWLGGVCGGATCLFGLLTAPAFHRRAWSAPALDQTQKWTKRMVAWLKAKFLASAGP